MTEAHHDWRDWSWRFVLHVLTGMLAVAIHYGIMACALYAGTTAVVASSIGFAGGAVVRFFTAYFKVFAPKNSVILTIPRFLLALTIQGLLNSALLTLLLAAGMTVWWAQITTTIAMTFLNYLVYRLWVFR